MRLEQILQRHGVSAGAKAKIMRAAKRYIRDGASIKDAQLSAVRDHREELRARQEEILSQVGGPRGGEDADVR